MTSQVSPGEPAGPPTSAAFAARGREADRPATGRQFTEPLRELAALVLLAGNAVFLFLGFTGLFLVLDGWATGFGARSAATFPIFVGPMSLSLPIVAVLLATHVAALLPRCRLILLAACAEYGVSAFFGFASFLGAFADDLPAARATLEGLLWRGVWLGFLALGALILARIYVGLMPARGVTAARPGAGVPGTPASYQTGMATPAYDEPTVDTGWPIVPPPPQPEPLVAPAAATDRVPHPPPSTPQVTHEGVPQPPSTEARPESDGEATQVVPAPAAGAAAPGEPNPSAAEPEPAAPVIDDPVEPPTRQFRPPGQGSTARASEG